MIHRGAQAMYKRTLTPKPEPRRGIVSERDGLGARAGRGARRLQIDLTESVLNVVLQKSTPPQICQLIHFNDEYEE